MKTVMFLPPNPPLHPSQEGNLQLALSTKLSSWEGQGVGSGVQCAKHFRRILSLILIGWLTDTARPVSASDPTANLAPKARVSASSQFSEELLTPPEEKTPKAHALRRDLVEGRFGFRDILLVQRKPLEISHVYVYHVEGFRPGGGLYIFTPDETGGQLRRIFDAGEGMITTADLSYDGREIVFAWRRGGHVASNPVGHVEDISQNPDEKHNYQIFRINLDGTGLTQLTHGAQNNLDPCWLPDGGIAFISDRRPAYAYCWVTTSPVLYRMERDGSKPKRLSANYLMDFTPALGQSGEQTRRDHSQRTPRHRRQTAS